MAANEDRPVRRRTRTSTVHGGGPAGRKAELEAQTRRLVAILVSTTFSAISLLVVVGGMVGRFDQTLVDAMVTALVGAAGAVWVYLFHRNKGESE